ncbi:MAG: acyltransferase family protein [Actinomycetota bacterium]|nr:acyltransferase family protein [Actinomycetota bacterium]
MPPAKTLPPKRIRHLPALDGLRGLALLAVLCYHAGLPWFRGGYLPLTTFFVLSGFLITALLLGERAAAGRIDLRAFWARRVRRLAPAALLGLGLIAAFVAWGPEGRYPGIRGDVFATLGWVANWRFIATDRPYVDAFASPSPLQHYWSLAVEEQFYVLLPVLALVLLALGRGRRHWFAGVVGALVVLSTLLAAHLTPAGDVPLRSYFGTDTRAAELLVGVLLACVLVTRTGEIKRFEGWAGRLLGAGGTVALVASAAVWLRVDEQHRYLYRGGLLGVALLAALVVTCATDDRRLVARLLALGPLARLGELSYGAYVFHWPVFLWLSPERTGLPLAPRFAVQVGVTLLLALASLHLIERPIRTGRFPTAIGAVGWANASVATAAVVVLATASVRGADIVETNPIGQIPAAPIAAPTIEPVTDAPAPSDTPEPGAGSAVAPSSPQPRRVLVIGDSVGMAMAHALKSWGGNGGRVVLHDATQLGCPISRGGVVHLSDGGTNDIPESCGWWATERFQQDLRTFRPDVVLVLAGLVDVYDRSGPMWDGVRAPGDPIFDRYVLDEWAAAASAMQATGAKVVWATPPCVDLSRSANVMDRDVADQRLSWIEQQLIPQLAAVRTVEVLDFAAQLCPDGSYTDSVFGIDGGRPDGVHFTTDAASAVIDGWLGPYLATLPLDPDTEAVVDGVVDDVVAAVP